MPQDQLYNQHPIDNGLYQQQFNVLQTDSLQCNNVGRFGKIITKSIETEDGISPTPAAPDDDFKELGEETSAEGTDYILVYRPSNRSYSKMQSSLISGIITGEVNTASGSGNGVSVYKGKTGVNIDLNDIRSADPAIGVVLNSGLATVDLSIVDGNIDHDSLSNYVAGQHRIINDSSTSTTELWSSNQINTVTTKPIYTTLRVTSGTTLDTTHYDVKGDTDGGAFTLTLPAGIAGKAYRIANTGSSGNTLTITPNGSELLIGDNSSYLLLDGDVLDIIYEATEGWV